MCSLSRSPSPRSFSLRSSLRRASHFPAKLRDFVPNLPERENRTNKQMEPMGEMGRGTGGGGGGRIPSAEVDSSSLDELSRFEPPERPPSLAQLQELTVHRFSDQWLKYIYNRFKHECPSGRMKFPEFRRLFGVFIPDRLSDTYLDRMFRAFCSSSAQSDYLTFKDLILCLHWLCDENAQANAEWTMRLISKERAAASGQQPQQSISYHEFYEFVRAVFALRGRGELHERKRRAGSLLLGGSGAPCARHDSTSNRRPPTVRSVAMLASAITAPTAIAHFGRARGSSIDGDSARAFCGQRASVVFKELDVDEKGFLTATDFERFFAKQQRPLIYVS